MIKIKIRKLDLPHKTGPKQIFLGTLLEGQ